MANLNWNTFHQRQEKLLGELPDKIADAIRQKPVPVIRQTVEFKNTNQAVQTVQQPLAGEPIEASGTSEAVDANSAVVEQSKKTQTEQLKVLKKTEQAEKKSYTDRAKFALKLSKQLSGGLKQGGEEYFETYKAISAAQALVATYLAANDVMAQEHLPLAGKLAAAAVVTAAGLANVSRIMSMSPRSQAKGSTNAAAPSLDSSMPTNNRSGELQMPQQVNIDLGANEGHFSRNQVIQLIENINELSGEGFQIQIGNSYR